MCNFFSGLITRTGKIYTHPFTDSHEELIKIFLPKAKDDGNAFARFEFTPQKNYWDVDSYKLNIDENVEPSWLDEEIKEKIIYECKTRISGMIVTGNKDLIINDIAILKDAIVKTIKWCRVVSMQNSTVNKMWGNSTVNEMWENSTVNKMWENSTVNKMWENSTVNEMWENSTVNKMWENSTVNKMWENSTVKTNNSKNEVK